jgi:paraquat-inducible protein B
MAKQANPTVIGAFVVGAIALAVIGTLALGGGELFAEKLHFVLFFEGSSLSGLDVGAPVNFQGVRIGSVSKVVIRVDPQKVSIRIPVYIDIEPDRLDYVGPRRENPYEGIDYLIKERGLRAQLATPSFVTGKQVIELDYHPDTPIRLEGADLSVHEIPTIPSMIETVTRSLQEFDFKRFFKDVSDTMDGIRELVRSPELQATITDADKMLKSFNKLAQNVDAQVEPIIADYKDTTARLRSALEQAERSVASAEDALSTTLDDVRTLVKDADAEVEPLSASAKDALREARDSLAEARETLAAIRRLVSEDSPTYYRVMSTVEEIGRAARSVRELADLLERQPESIIKGKP